MQTVNYQTMSIPFETTRIIASGHRDFAAVVQRIGEVAGQFDNQKFVDIVRSQQSTEAIKKAAEAMAGPSGFMIFATLEHGKLLSIGGQSNQAKLYIIGNPLIARLMFQHDSRMGLYVPLRLYVYESDEGQTCIAYDQPSSLLAQFQNEAIQATAHKLDQKLAAMVDMVL